MSEFQGESKRLFNFSTPQHTYDIKGVKIGGQPGQHPTVMIGSIFYHGDKIVENEEEGIFDKKKADERLNREAELSAKFGIPRIIDVVASFPKAAAKYLDYVSDSTESPFLIDGVTENVRIAAIKHAKDIGVIDRVIYNSITPRMTAEEIAALKESGVKTAILLTLNTQKPTIQGRIETLENLVHAANEAGVTQYLIDTTIIDTIDPGVCAKTCYLEKEKYGYPAGCGPHNAVDRWRQIRKLEPDEKLMATAVANTLPIVLGADFILYGPMKNAPAAYEMCAIVDAYVSYSMRQEFRIAPESKTHPVTRVFRKE